MRETVLVTGAAGFIGRAVVRLLVERGYAVTGLDNFRFSNRDQVPQHREIEWVDGDTLNRSLVTYLMKSVDHVIHLAAPSSFIMHEEDDIEACSLTLLGFKTVIECLRKRGLKKITWASTSAVYELAGQDKTPRVPFHEGLEISPPDSKSGCKWFCEQEARRYNERYGVSSVAFRPFSVYGAGEHTKGGYANVTSLFTWALLGGHELVLWGDGKQTRDFIFVDDVARAFVDGMEKDVNGVAGEGHCTLNLGMGIEHSFNDVVRLSAEALKVNPRVRYVDVPIQIYAYRLWADTSKTERVLGFKPKVSLEEGIERIIAAYHALPADVRERLNLEVQQHYFKKLEAKPEAVLV